ncbi:hypothetical protein [Micromonospora sp. NPDC048839]
MPDAPSARRPVRGGLPGAGGVATPAIRSAVRGTDAATSATRNAKKVS